MNAQVVDARDGYQLWSQTFDREAGDVLAVQNEIGRAVAQALQVTLLPTPATEPGAQPIDPEVYNQYLLARRFLGPVQPRRLRPRRRGVREGHLPLPVVRAGVGHPGRGVRRHGRLRERSARRSRPTSGRPWPPPSAPSSSIPALAEAYAARAQLLAQTTWDWEAAREDFDRALALAPGDADILRKKGAWLLAPQGRIPEAIDVLRRSTELDPLSASAWTTLGLLEVAASNGDAGERALLRAIEIDPDNDYAHQALGVRLLLAGEPGCRTRPDATAARPGCGGCAGQPWPSTTSAAPASRTQPSARAHLPAGRPLPFPDRRGPRLARRGRPGLRLAREGPRGARRRAAPHHLGPAAREDPRRPADGLPARADEPAAEVTVAPRNGEGPTTSGPSGRRSPGADRFRSGNGSTARSMRSSHVPGTPGRVHSIAPSHPWANDNGSWHLGAA